MAADSAASAGDICRPKPRKPRRDVGRIVALANNAGAIVSRPATSRHARGYGTAWDKLRKIVLRRDAYLCQHCLTKGRPTPATEVDHILPKAKGGDDALDNLQALCADCHKAKTQVDSGATFARDDDGWLIPNR